MQATLIAARVPASAGKPGPDGGAVIHLDLGADTWGGIYIAWNFPRAQHEEIMNYLSTRQDPHPRVEYFFEVQRAMRDAIMAILHAAGLTAARAEDHNYLTPRYVLVPQQAFPS